MKKAPNMGSMQNLRKYMVSDEVTQANNYTTPALVSNSLHMWLAEHRIVCLPYTP